MHLQSEWEWEKMFSVCIYGLKKIFTFIKNYRLSANSKIASREDVKAHCSSGLSCSKHCLFNSFIKDHLSL